MVSSGHPLVLMATEVNLESRSKLVEFRIQKPNNSVNPNWTKKELTGSRYQQVFSLRGESKNIKKGR